MKKHAKIFTDGGARGNPGPAGIGVVIEFFEKTYTFKEYIGETTNNQAEYSALLLALKEAKDLGVSTADIYMDSLLIVNQMLQKFKVKEPELAKLFVRAWNLVQGFEKVSFHHIPREKNKEADALVNMALDEVLK
jgi:ribonuclease HI